MVSKLSDGAKLSMRFAQAPWNEGSEPWCQLDAQLPSDHLARELRSAMANLDLTPLYTTYAGRGKVPYRPKLMLTIMLFELRRGRRQPCQWYQDTHENYVLWWLGFGIKPSRGESVYPRCYAWLRNDKASPTKRNSPCGEWHPHPTTLYRVAT
jgi:hypothetical protein